MKIGLISDTHIPEVAKRLPQEVARVFSGVDLILHAGDIHALFVLDELEHVAPVLAVRGNGDNGDGVRPRPDNDPRLKDRVLTLPVEGLRLGMIHALPPYWRTFEETFDGSVDILVFGDSHVPWMEQRDGTLLVNPGSPTLPANLRRELGTVALLDIAGGKAEAEIVDLREWS
jgi:hypothetical protein